MSDQARRRQYLRELVEHQVVPTQEALVQAVREAGFEATQATVSRDIRELGLIRMRTRDGGFRYGLPTDHHPAPSIARLERLLSDTYVSVARAGNLVVLKLLPGNAHAVGVILDDMMPPGLVGTVAGDDTVLIICENAAAAKRSMALLSPRREPVP
ncbi:MAG: arginine repressor [Clostridia bacterium]